MNRTFALLALVLSLLAPASMTLAGERVERFQNNTLHEEVTSPEELDLSQSVAREIGADDGAVFLVTVVPPEGGKVDLRFFDTFQIVPMGNDGITSKAAGTIAGPSVDVSGYTVLVDQLEKSTAATCTGYLTKGYNYTLSGGATYQFCPSGTPEYVAATAYPETGDVDIYVVSGSTTCSSSVNGTGTLDVAGCSNSACATTAKYCAQYRHYYSSTSTSTRFDWSYGQYLVN